MAKIVLLVRCDIAQARSCALAFSEVRTHLRSRVNVWRNRMGPGAYNWYFLLCINDTFGEQAEPTLQLEEIFLTAGATRPVIRFKQRIFVNPDNFTALPPPVEMRWRQHIAARIKEWREKQKKPRPEYEFYDDVFVCPK